MKYIVTVYMVLLCLTSHAQQIKPLVIGDIVPDLVFHKVLNHKKNSLRLSDFNGKLVILDMWSTLCSSCIAAFPKMEELQRKYANKIQVLLVNPNNNIYDSEERIFKVLNKLKERSGFYPSLPIPAHDSILNAYFPHEVVPHQVWIGADRKIVAITSMFNDPFKQVQNYLEGKPLDLSIKDDYAFKKGVPLIAANLDADKAMVFHSALTGFVDRIKGGTGLEVNDKQEITRYYLLNVTLRHLVHKAYKDQLVGTRQNTQILEVKNPAQYSFDYDPQHLYCYDLWVPGIQHKQFRPESYLKEDLRRSLNISVYREKRNMKCLVITASAFIKGYPAKSVKTDMDLDTTSIRKFVHNYPLKDFLDRIDILSKIPVINATGLANNIDIDFPDHFNLNDSAAVMRFLKSLGFEIKEEVRELEVAVITDKNNN